MRATRTDVFAIKRIPRYLKETKKSALYYSYSKKSDLRLTALFYSDWPGSCEDRMSLYGFVIFLGPCLVSWKTTKQKCVALFTSKAEFIALSECLKELMWLRDMLGEIGFQQEAPTKIYEDNAGAIAWAGSQKRRKHIDIRYHFVKDALDEQIVYIEFYPTERMTANIMTKPLQKTRFEKIWRDFGVVDSSVMGRDDDSSL